MFQNYFTVALRNLRKNKFFTFLNITGLAVGLACCMLIALYVYQEMHYDRHHERAADLYLVGTTFVKIQGLGDDPDHETYNTPAPMAEALMQEFPEIEKTTRIQGVFEGDKTLLRLVEDDITQKAFNEPKGVFADSTYFGLFQYQFLEGDPAKALTEPQTVVLSEEIARKFFGNEPAYGRSIRISSNTWFEGGDLDFRVTGVFRQPTASTHLDGRFFMSLYSGGLGDFLKRKNDLASNNMFSTYLLLHPGADGKALEAKLPAFVDKYMAGDLKERGFNKKQFLTALRDVHLSEVGTGAKEGRNSMTYLYIVSSIALFTLLIACVNFMNLSTARSARRASEVGVRKSVGASKGNL
ncbi:MAG TPA: ABC transporter permease, partial [Saprospiraceae bacterium]|nr:ABC transporter permease [Saprospiraceae bacterium]